MASHEPIMRSIIDRFGRTDDWLRGSIPNTSVDTSAVARLCASCVRRACVVYGVVMDMCGGVGLVCSIVTRRAIVRERERDMPDAAAARRRPPPPAAARRPPSLYEHAAQCVVYLPLTCTVPGPPE